MVTEEGRIKAPYSPDELDEVEMDPQPGMYFSTGYVARVAVKITEQRVYHDNVWRHKKNLGWTNLSEVKAWGRTEEECKARIKAYNELYSAQRGLQREAEEFVREGLKAEARRLWEAAEERYGAELDRICTSVMSNTGYSDYFCSRSIHPTAVRVWPD